MKQFSGYKGLTHILESKLSYIFGSIAFIAIFLIISVTWGLPWASKVLANFIPTEVSIKLGEGVLESIDSLVFEPSELEQYDQEKWRETFVSLLPEETIDFSYKLEFRSGGIIGPNALALPDGTVVVTDELIHLAKVDEEIQSVLLHEIGHVVNRHGLRRIITHSSLAIIVSLFAADLSSAGAIVLAVPSILMESSYSRDLEWEADDYSLNEMQRLGIETVHFANFMLRLESEISEQPDQYEDEGEEESNNWMNYISTHPPTADRVARFQ